MILPSYRVSYSVLGLILGSLLLACGGTGSGGESTSIPLQGDTTPPSVSATTPVNNATNVSISSSLTATFSEPVNSATFTAATATLSPPTAGNITVTGTTAMFTPSTLLPNTTYTATLTTGIKDLAGNALATDFFWSFTTGTAPDITAPTVSATTPSSNATNVSISSSLTATFSEPVNSATVTAATFTLKNSANIPVTGDITTNGTTVMFALPPGTPLTSNTLYTATLTTGITDLAGNPLTTNFHWSFTTGATPDTTPPTVSATTPGNNATNVSISSSLTATFSEPVNSATVTAATFTLKNSANTPVTGNITTNGTTVTFALLPGTPLTSNTLYTATLTTGITDLAGNPLMTNFHWSFTTGATPDTTPPTVGPTNPTNGATNVSVSSSLTATFSEPVNSATVTATTFTLSPPTAGNITVTGTTAMFTPSTLLPNTTYTATLTTGIKDLAGNALATNFTWSFTTASGATTTLGLDFPGSAAVATTMRFRFTNPHTNGLPIYGPNGQGVTYIWRAYPRQQAGYYTAFFWGNDNGGDNNTGFRWNNGLADTYYGAHPYPDTQPSGSTHKWEIALESNDFVNGTVDYDRWYTQALRVWKDASDNSKHHEFYWDLPNTDAVHMVSHTSGSQWNNDNPPVPALTWGDAPWNPGAEVWNGVLRGIQIYATNLSLADIQSEIASPKSTAAGASTIWYLNVNPTPTDISDKSGKGHNPEWVGSERPALYTGP